MTLPHVIRTGNGRSSMPKIILMTVFNPLLILGTSHRLCACLRRCWMRFSDLRMHRLSLLSDRARQASQPHQPVRTSRSADPLESTGVADPYLPASQPSSSDVKEKPIFELVAELMSFDRGTKWCFHVLLLACVIVGCAWWLFPC